MEIAKNLISYREKYKCAQSFIAEQLEVLRVTISNWEKGKTTPDIYNLLKICDLYHISLDELIKEGAIQVKKDYENHAYNAPLKIVYGTKFRPRYVSVKSTIDMDTGEVTFRTSKSD